MTYAPHTPDERAEMLSRIGVANIEALFTDVPASARFPQLNLPPALSEPEALRELYSLAASNGHAADMPIFLGAGAYYHFIPSHVSQLLLRGEFLTAYTPYQPEVSQGTLQVIYEYQSMMSLLTGMDVSNASHYDGGTSLAEGVIMALNIHRRKRTRVVLSPGIHPMYREIARTYTPGLNVEYVGDDNPHHTLSDLLALTDHNTAILFVQYPNFFGDIEDLTGLADALHAKGALLGVVTNPLTLGLLRPPGDFGADIVLGEAQPLGIPLSYGGPYLGFFATRTEYVRKMAGRLAGETLDRDGKRGFVLTLTPREQHIRREKATSNICTNQGLMATAATIYLATLGKHGLRQVAELCYHRAHYAAEQIAALDGFEVVNPGPFFHEFVVRCPVPVKEINDELYDHYDIIGGYDLSADYPHLQNCMLIAVTEMNSREDIDNFVAALKEIAGGNHHG